MTNITGDKILFTLFILRKMQTSTFKTLFKKLSKKFYLEIFVLNTLKL